MRKQLLLILTVCLLFSYAYAQTIVLRRVARIRTQVIHIELSERGHIFLPVRVNNSEPLWFVLDSGSSSTLLNKRLVKKLNLKVEGVGEASGAGAGADEGLLTSGVSLSLSGIKMPNQQIPAIDFKRLEASMGRDIDGLLGYDFMRHFVFEVDYEARVIKVHDAATYLYRGRGEVLPITTEDGHPHVRLKFTLPERETLEGKFIVDGGAGGATMEFASPFAQAHKLLDTVQLEENLSVPGIGGGVKISRGRGKSIRLGRLLLENPIVGFPQANRGAFANRKIAGVIGTKLLRRFTVIYDDRRRRIIFEPNSSFAQPE